MKYVWEEADIRPGRVVCKPNQDESRPWEASGWTAKWTEKIGFTVTSSDKSIMRICVADGMVSGPFTKAEVVDSFNKDGIIPMPHEWLLKTIDYLRGCYE